MTQEWKATLRIDELPTKEERDAAHKIVAILAPFSQPERAALIHKAMARLRDLRKQPTSDKS